MRRLTAFALFALTACSMQQQDGSLRVMPSPILSSQHWEISQQEAGTKGRLCTVSAGEMDVTQLAQNRHMEPQVSTSQTLNPGSRYRIMVNGHSYETETGWFSARDSAAIITDLKNSATAYTEIRESAKTGLPTSWRHWSNTIPLAGFPAAYRECERYVLRQ